MLREPNREQIQKHLREYAMHHFFAKTRKNKICKINAARPANANVKKPKQVVVLVPVSLGLRIDKSCAERERDADA
jgi:hypothetical protein